MAPPTVTSDKCNIVISFEEAESYEIELLTSSSEYELLPFASPISMSVFFEVPYLL